MTTAEHPRKSKADAEQAKPSDPPAQPPAPADPADPAPEADRYAHVRPGLVGIFGSAGGVQLVLRRDGDTVHVVGTGGYFTTSVKEWDEDESPAPGDAMELLADHIAAGFSLSQDTAPFAAPVGPLPIANTPAGREFRAKLLKHLSLDAEDAWTAEDILEAIGGEQLRGDALGRALNKAEAKNKAASSTPAVEEAVRVPRIGQLVSGQDDESGIVVATYPAVTKGPITCDPLVLFRDPWGQIRNSYVTDLEWDQSEKASRQSDIQSAGPDRATILRAGIIDGIGDTDEEESDFDLIARLKMHIANEEECESIAHRWSKFSFEANKFLDPDSESDTDSFESLLRRIKALREKAAKNPGDV